MTAAIFSSFIFIFHLSFSIFHFFVVTLHP